MVTIHIKKSVDFETRPELDLPRQTFKSLKDLIATSPDTPVTNYLGNFRGSYLNTTVAVLKANNLRAQKFENTQKVEEGNLILETKVQVHPNILTLYINLQEIGVIEGRASYEIKPTQNGFWLHAQEMDYYKNSQNEEAHALKRTIARNYTVNGPYDWHNMHCSLMPDGSLYIVVSRQNHPASPMSFSHVNSGPVYSSIAGHPEFPPVDPTATFLKFSNFQPSCPKPSTVSKCCQCGGVKSTGVQTGGSLCALPNPECSISSLQFPPTPENPTSLRSFGSSWFWCSCDSMDC